MPGILVSIVCATLMSPFSISRPHSAIEKGDIKVTQTMETNIPGIYAAGDITTYPGKLKLIATGFSEACIAVNQIAHFLNPAAKVMPGHSSNMALFGQKDD